MLAICLLLSASVFAGKEYTKEGSIKGITTYDNYVSEGGTQGSDVIFGFDTGLPVCASGVWLSPKDIGYKNILSILLTSYTTKQKVQFSVYNEHHRKFKGSSSGYCKIYGVFLKD